MLTPEYLDSLPDNLILLYAQAESDIIADMVRRLTTYNYFIPAAQWQYIKAREMGLLYDDIMKRLSTATGISKKEIERMMKAAGAEALKTDDAIYKRTGLNPGPISSSVALRQVLAAGIEKTNGLFKNLTGTTANTATKQFENILDRAYLQITSGAFDYNSAIRSAIKELSSKGIASITYPSGHTDYIETAVRRATVTGVNQTAARLQIMRADEMESDLVEVTAHAGARPGHAMWQGRIYSRSETSSKYPPFSDTGYGTGAGLCGWNCRHNFYPFFEDAEPAYGKEQLKEYNEKNYEYNGQKMTEYEATQKQRYIERQMKQWKRENVAMNAAGMDTAESAAKIAHWQQKQKDFIQQTGLKRQRDREQIGGYGKKQAGKVRHDVEKYKRVRYNKDGTVVVTDNWIEKSHPRIPSTYRTNAVVDIVSQSGKQRDRIFYDEQGRQHKQISAGPHGNLKQHPYGDRGEHAHDIRWEDGKIVDRPRREIRQEERKENADIL